MGRVEIVVAAALVAGCARENPVFEVRDSLGQTGTSSGAMTSTDDGGPASTTTGTSEETTDTTSTASASEGETTTTGAATSAGEATDSSGGLTQTSEAASSSGGPAPSCGDAEVDPGEQCDEGDDSPTCQGCMVTPCLVLYNDWSEQGTADDWFDACVAREGGTVRLALIFDQDVLYAAQGAKVGEWSVDHVTSTAAPLQQWNPLGHERLIELDTGEFLMITGKGSKPFNPGCPQSLGDGYTLTVLPFADPPPGSVDLLVAPFRGGNSDVVRSFPGWHPAKEISFAGGAPMNMCEDNGLFPALFTTLVVWVLP